MMLRTDAPGRRNGRAEAGRAAQRVWGQEMACLGEGRVYRRSLTCRNLGARPCSS